MRIPYSGVRNSRAPPLIKIHKFFAPGSFYSNPPPIKFFSLCSPRKKEFPGWQWMSTKNCYTHFLHFIFILGLSFYVRCHGNESLPREGGGGQGEPMHKKLLLICIIPEAFKTTWNWFFMGKSFTNGGWNYHNFRVNVTFFHIFTPYFVKFLCDRYLCTFNSP